MATTDTATKVVTGRVRLSYCHLLEPHSNLEGKDPNYSVVLLIPKSDTATLNAMKKAQKAALEQGKSSKFNGKIPPNWKNTLRDGDEEKDTDESPEYADHMFITVSSNRKPGIVDRQKEPITSSEVGPDGIYSGCYARVSLNAYPFNTQGNKGVSFGLQNVQKLADGEPLGNVSTPEKDFDDLDDEDLAGSDLL